MSESSLRILDGKWLAQLVRQSIRRSVDDAVQQGRRAPGLAVILVGDNPASKTYVANKGKFAAEAGLRTFDTTLPAEATFDQVAHAISAYNLNPEVDGILLQLPLPRHLDSNSLLDLIDPKKDADGLHPLNQGLLMRGSGYLKPCTPQGSLALIDLALSQHEPAQIESFDQIVPQRLAGKRAVVIGRSILVGKPLGLMLLERDATVGLVHSKTPQIEELCAEADILVAAVGVPHLVKRSWVKPGAIVIDVGINRLSTGKLCGDVDYDDCAGVASAITPVPGGVGPMTIAMLVQNTFESYRRSELER